MLCAHFILLQFTIPLLKPRISELSYIAVQFGYISSLIKVSLLHGLYISATLFPYCVVYK